MAGFLAELKRRNVVKVGIAYAAAGWLVVETASVVFPTFKAPEWVLQVLTTLVILGLPIALVLAWVFELTPDGLKRTSDVTADQPSGRPSGRRLDVIIIGVLAAAVAALLIDRFVRKDEGSDAAVPTAAVQGAPEAALARNSIAVLPFVNMSSDPEQEYFSDGLTEELLSRLSRIPALKVPARTSSFYFKGKDTDLRDVGRMLGVRSVLEGSVRKSGQKVRISAQLSDVETGYHLWAQTYDREVIDVFEVQDEITSQITAALEVQLDSGSERTPAGNRIAADIYQLMLRGRYHWNQRTADGLARAVDLFHEVTRRDPAYARGYAGLADAYLSQFDYGLLSWEESTTKARAATLTALELDDGLAEAHTSLAHILLHEWKWQAAEQEFLRAIELDPSYVVARHWYALCLTALGRVREAVQTMQQAQELDPVSVRVNADLGMAYLAAGRYDEAIVQEERTLELAPAAPTPKWIRAMALEQLGRFDEAESDMEVVLEAWPGDPTIIGSLGHLYAVAGQESKARELLSGLIAEDGTTEIAFFVALIHAGLNEETEALAWLDRAVEERSGSVRYLKIDPRLQALHDEPGYRGLLEKVGLPSD